MDKARDAQAVELRRAISALLRLFLVNERRFPVAGRNERYSPLDFQALSYLATNPGAKMGELGEFLFIAPTTTTTLVDRLVRRRLVERKVPADDKRAKALWLTDSGRAMFDAIYEQDMRNMKAVLEVLRPEERAQLVAMLSKVARELDAD